jgi:hypothetical protein
MLLHVGHGFALRKATALRLPPTMLAASGKIRIRNTPPATPRDDESVTPGLTNSVIRDAGISKP